MKVKEQQIVYTRYLTMETVNGDFHYRTDWTGVWWCVPICVVVMLLLSYDISKMMRRGD